VAFVSFIGSASVASKIDVVDHTTEAPPDAIDELQQQYVAGDIDADELERQAEAVLRR
jgi:uncharacterized membrane protein